MKDLLGLRQNGDAEAIPEEGHHAHVTGWQDSEQRQVVLGVVRRIRGEYKEYIMLVTFGVASILLARYRNRYRFSCRATFTLVVVATRASADRQDRK